jgi:hypothetical protein
VSGNKQISAHISKGFLKMLKLFCLENDLTYGQAFEGLICFTESLGRMDYPKEIKDSIDGAFENALNRAKRPYEERSGWVGVDNDKPSLFKE